MFRSLAAVLAGILTLTALSFGIEAIIGAGNKVLMAAYSLLSIAAGGYVTAWIASRRHIFHAVLMGAIQSILTFMVMFDMRDALPLWGWILSIALTTPAAWLGGALHATFVGRQGRPRET